MDKGRKNDIKQLEKDLGTARNSLQRRKILEAGDAIRKEQMDGYVRSARESMIRTMQRTGKADDQKYYGDEMMKYQKRAGIGGGRVSFAISTKGIKGY